VTSIFDPGLSYAGKSAVTITAATSKSRTQAATSQQKTGKNPYTTHVVITAVYI
jgi:hypothetical protein